MSVSTIRWVGCIIKQHLSSSETCCRVSCWDGRTLRRWNLQCFVDWVATFLLLRGICVISPPVSAPYQPASRNWQMENTFVRKTQQFSNVPLWSFPLWGLFSCCAVLVVKVLTLCNLHSHFQCTSTRLRLATMHSGLFCVLVSSFILFAFRLVWNSSFTPTYCYCHPSHFHPTAKDKGEKKLFGYSFVPLMQEDGRTLPDGTHELIIHKVIDNGAVQKLTSLFYNLSIFKTLSQLQQQRQRS